MSTRRRAACGSIPAPETGLTIAAMRTLRMTSSVLPAPIARVESSALTKATDVIVASHAESCGPPDFALFLPRSHRYIGIPLLEGRLRSLHRSPPGTEPSTPPRRRSSAACSTSARRSWGTPRPVSQATAGLARWRRGSSRCGPTCRRFALTAMCRKRRRRSTRRRPRSTSSRSPTSGPSITCGTNQRLLASDVVFGDGLERSETALASLEQARVAELQAREAAVSVFRSRQVFALTAGAAAAVLVVLLLVPGAQAGTRGGAGPGLDRSSRRKPWPPPSPRVTCKLDDEIVSVPRAGPGSRADARLADAARHLGVARSRSRGGAGTGGVTQAPACADHRLRGSRVALC